MYYTFHMFLIQNWPKPFGMQRHALFISLMKKYSFCSSLNVLQMEQLHRDSSKKWIYLLNCQPELSVVEATSLIRFQRLPLSSLLCQLPLVLQLYLALFLLNSQPKNTRGFQCYGMSLFLWFCSLILSSPLCLCKRSNKISTVSQATA